MSVWRKALCTIITLVPLVQGTRLPATASNNSLIENRWTDGWYLLAGIGPSGSRYINDRLNERSSWGFHLSTSIGYFSRNCYGIEIGSITSLTYYDDIPVENAVENGDAMVYFWNTVFFWSIRVRFPEFEHTNMFNPYLRLLQGWGDGVGFIRGLSDDISYLKGRRIQLEGPVYGISFGNIFNTESDQTMWFLELSLILQIYWDGYIVQSSEELPIILEKVHLNENDRNVQFHITAGFRFI